MTAARDTADAVARYRAASEANDLDAALELVADDAALVSPVSARLVFRGKDDLRVLLGAVFRTIRGLRWDQDVGEGRERVLVGEFRVGPFRLGDAMVLELDDEGLIRRIRPHLRPLLPLVVFALALGPRLAPRPGVFLRALRRP